MIDSTGAVRDSYRYYAYGGARGEAPDSAEPYRYTGKPLETEGDLNIYYYGARYYDPELGRFLALDPAAQKYPGWSPYAYTLDNPLKFVDPDGEKVEFAPNQTQQFKQDFAKAIQYMNRHGISGTFARLEKLPQTVYISAAPAGMIDAYQPSTRTIFWSSRIGIEWTSGGKVSPAIAVLHEAAHAEQHLTNPQQYRSDRNTRDAQYGNKEEKRVITNVETPAAQKAGEGTRTDHSATRVYQVDDPTHRIPPPPLPPLIQ